MYSMISMGDLHTLIHFDEQKVKLNLQLKVWPNFKDHCYNFCHTVLLHMAVSGGNSVVEH